MRASKMRLATSSSEWWNLDAKFGQDKPGQARASENEPQRATTRQNEPGRASTSQRKPSQAITSQHLPGHSTPIPPGQCCCWQLFCVHLLPSCGQWELSCAHGLPCCNQHWPGGMGVHFKAVRPETFQNTVLFAKLGF